MGTPLAGQIVEVAARGPRFLTAAAPSAVPVPLDVSQVEIFRRRISVDLVNASLEQALAEITRQSGLRFMYSKNALMSGGRVQLQAKSITVAAALTELLVDAKVDVVLTRNGQAMLVPQDAARPAGATGTLAGRVTDVRTSKSIEGAEVLLEGTRQRTATDTSGRYLLGDVDAGKYALIVRRLGYKKESRQIVVREAQTDTVDIALEPAVVPLDELVTTATGTQRRRDLGNAITTIRADSVLKSAPIHNLTDLLDGRVPGMSLQHTSGAPGDPAKIRLRGLGSITRSNDPVIIVDGIRINSDQSSRRSGNLTNLMAFSKDTNGFSSGGPIQTNNPAPSPLDQIDPNIIDKIEVFKGPSAATLYGADAANGVIVVTTKRGKPGPTRWNASFSQSRTTSPGAYPTAYFRWGRLTVDGDIVAFCPLTSTQCALDSLVRFQALNDPELTVLGTGRRTGLSLTASGGNQALTYSITGSYGDELGQLKLPEFAAEQFRTLYNREPFDWMRRPHHYKTWGVTSNVTALLGRVADVTLMAQLSSSDQQRSTLENELSTLEGSYLSAATGCCLVPQHTGNAYTVGFANPLSAYYVRNTASSLTFNTGLTANWRPSSWFTGTAQAGVSVEPRDDEALLPIGLPLTSGFDDGSVTRGTGNTRTGTFKLQGTVQKLIGWGFRFQTSAGVDLTTSNTADLVTTGWGLRPGTTSLNEAAELRTFENRIRSSVFGWYVEPRITGQRISLSTGIRLDGGSAYGARVTGFGGGGGLLGGLLALPKLNGSWVISEEPWFPFSGLVSSLRLRGAYGQAQVQPGATDRIRLYQTRFDEIFGPVLGLSSVGNVDLKPERSTEFEGGFDADLLDNRVSVELTGYRKTQVDALMPLTLPLSVNGGGFILQNLGNIRNTGLELMANVQPVRTPIVTWGIGLNYSRNTNVLTKLGAGVVENREAGLVEGYPVGGRFARPILGFSDADRNGVISPDEVVVGDSMVFMGRLLPAYESSFSTNVALFHNAVRITADFQYEGGATQIDQTAKTNWVLNPALFDPATPLSEQAAVIANDVTDYGLMQTVSTFRFKSFSVNYQVPPSVARLLRAQSMTVSIRGDNLGLHTSYRGKDPDVTAWSPGEGIVDTGQLTRPRTWELAAFMNF